MSGILTVVVSIIVGVVIRVVYDFVVKPRLKKSKQNLTDKQLKHLIKSSSENAEDFDKLLKFLQSSDNILYKDYYNKLLLYNKADLDEQQKSDFEDILKHLKKSIK